MSKMKKVLLMLVCAVVLVSQQVEGATLVSTGFDSSEGWVEGGVTVAPNPAVGNWYSYYGSSGQTSPAWVDLSGNGVDYEAPLSGDGLFYTNRVGVPWGPQSKMEGIVSGWADNAGGPIVEVKVDIQVAGNYVAVGIKNSPTDASMATMLGAILTAGTDIAYWSGGWVWPQAGYGKVPIGYWDTLRIVGNNTTQTYSVYIGATTIGENIPYAHTYGDGVVRSAVFTLGGAGRLDADNLLITGIPEPATMALLGFGGLLLARRRKS